MHPDSRPSRGVPGETSTGTISRYFEAPGLSVRVYPRAGWVVIQVAGELDVQVVPRIRWVLDAHSGLVVFDLERVTFLDAGGLALLVVGFECAKRAGGAARVAAPSRQVRRLLAITRLAREVPVFDTLDEALSAPGPPQRASGE